MKKYFLLFAAGGLLTLASCGGETTPAEPTLNVDSMKTAIADSTAAALQAQNDSLVNAAAKVTADSLAAATAKADSIAAAAAKAAGKKVAPKKVAPKKGTTQVVKEVAAPPKPGGLKGSSDQNTQGGGLRSNSDQNTQGGGLRSHSDQNGK